MNREERSPKIKKIALWGAGIFSDQTGSKGIPSLIEILQGLSKSYDITIYSHLPLIPADVPAGIKVRKVPSWSNSNRRLRVFFLVLFFIYDQIVNKYALIQAHSSHPDPLIAVVLGKLFTVPIIVGFNAGEFVELPSIKFGAFLEARQRRINCWVVNHATAVTAVSKFHASTIEKYLKDGTKLKVIYRGVNQSKFSYEKKILTYPVNFIQVAYLHPIKDQVTLLKTFSILSQHIPCHLHIVGPDFLNNKIHQLVKELNLDQSVTFYGAIPHYEISTLYHRAHVMLHTAQYEAIGAVTAEAMSCGVLVCGTHVGLMADLSGECCVTVPPQDYQGLANNVLVLLKNTKEMERLRSNGLKWVDNHNLLWAIKEYEKLYEGLTQRNKM
jgi:glycosyltransferase involved in cell wall biosynthesis